MLPIGDGQLVPPGRDRGGEHVWQPGAHVQAAHGGEGAPGRPPQDNAAITRGAHKQAAIGRPGQRTDETAVCSPEVRGEAPVLSLQELLRERAPEPEPEPA